MTSSPQHSTKFTASPPRPVSLYFDCMSAPVSAIVLNLKGYTRCFGARSLQRS
jgi:hypothetical protein